MKHNGPLLDLAGNPTEKYKTHGIPGAIVEFDRLFPLDLSSFASAEAQVAAIADDIAYNAHDIDDGLRAGLFSVRDLREAPFLAEIADKLAFLWPDIDMSHLGYEIVRRVITIFVEDVIGEAERRLVRLKPACAADIRAAQHAVVTFSAAMAEAARPIKGFLYPRMYRHPQVMRIRADAGQIVHDLFDRYLAEPGLMPEEWQRDLGDDPARRARRVADYIAGMTDRYAVDAHRRLFDATPALR